ncbi:MAG: universal stress protein [Pseudonocardia sp.]|nr:universal stress protein [Pseudonocardia sp.]MBO0873134.1 universal stress protein [Pseudonocardia sp.]
MTERSLTVPRGAVLVGVDGSDHSLAAVRWAAEEAGSRRAPLVIMHAAPRVRALATERSGAYGHAHALLTQAEAEATAHGVATADHVVVADGAVPALVHASQRAALVVLGATGSGGAGEIVLGSTLLAVSGQTRCPVVGVRRWPLEPSVQRAVVVGVASVRADEPAVEIAFDLARRRCRRLVVVHTRSLSAAGLPDELAAWRGRYPEVDVSYRFPCTQPATALLELAARAEAVVTGSRHRGPAARALLGSTSRTVLRYSPAPVVVTGRGPVETTEAEPSTSRMPAPESDPHDRAQLW